MGEAMAISGRVIIIRSLACHHQLPQEELDGREAGLLRMDSEYIQRRHFLGFSRFPMSQPFACAL